MEGKIFIGGGGEGYGEKQFLKPEICQSDTA